jgi:hypothetical protein
MFGAKSKINIQIQKVNYAPGDTISGNVILTLSKPVNAREVSISLIGEAWVSTYSGTTDSSGVSIGRRSPGGGMFDMNGRTMMGEGGLWVGSEETTATLKQLERIYDFKQQLDGEKEYIGGPEYHFEIKIPGDIVSVPPQMAGRIQSPVRWYLLAQMDIPHGPDISKKADITVG